MLDAHRMLAERLGLIGYQPDTALEMGGGYDPAHDPLDPSFAQSLHRQPVAPHPAVLDALDQLLGLTPPPAAEPVDETPYQPGGLDRFAERLSAGFQPMPASDFGTGLASGLLGGLAGRGRQVAARRAEHEARLEKRRGARDAANLEATRDYQSTRRQGAVKLLEKPASGGVLVDDALVAANPKLKSFLGRTIPNAVYERMTPQASTEKPVKPDAEPIVAIEGPNGPVYVKRSDALGKAPAAGQPKSAKVTGQDRQSLSYYNRAKQAVETIAQPDRFGETLEQRISRTSLLGQAQLQYGGMGANVLKTPEQRAYRQAQRAFTEARLRKESGAAIPVHEYENDAATYFAQPGDDAGTIEQKRVARDKVLEGLGFAAGPAYEEFYGEPFPAAALAAPGAGRRPSRAATPPYQPGGFFDAHRPGGP